MHVPDVLTDVFSALADPTRRAILTRLSDGAATVAQLAEPFAMSQPAVSKHLKVLERAGLISRSRAGTSRYSHLEGERLKEAGAWMLRYAEAWNDGFDRLDAALAEYMQQSQPDEQRDEQDEQQKKEQE